MARQGDPADLRLVVKFLRSLPDWTQEELSRASGVDRGLISDYELGDKTPTRRTLERLASAVRLPFSYVEAFLPLFRAARLAREGGFLDRRESAAEEDAPEGVGDGLDQAILSAIQPRIRPYLVELETLVAGGPSVSANEARRKAGEFWEALSRLTSKRRRAVVEAEPKYWTWAVAERLCAESVRAAAHQADRAAELAKLALRVAELAPGTEPWRSRLKGYTWAFVANARRVLGDLPGAEEAFARSGRLWKKGESAAPGVLDGSRPLALKASLLRYQGRLQEALDLLEQAQELSGSAEAGARLLVKTANTLELMGHYDRALKELQRAGAVAESSQDTRLSWMIRFAQGGNLWQLGRYTEAEALLPAIREQAVNLGNDLDLIRTLWLEGRVAAGLRRWEAALTALEQVRRYFTAQQIAYDAALASLEVAVLYLEEERAGEVKAMAEEMVWIFKAQGVQAEALAALRLFCEAAEREEATAGLARRVAEFLVKARHNPGLRFEAK